MNKSELERRAQARRNAALKSDTEIDLENRAKARRAYMQGGPGPNDPKALGYPGELKYPRMEVPVGGDSRQWEENWFMGAAEVTKQKMGPSGVELELKKKMQRASLTAQFIREADAKNSYWNFFATDKKSGKKELLFKASVDEIFGRDGQEVDPEHWKWVSSQDYAKYAMQEMRKHGIEKVAYALKGVGLTREGTIKIIREEALDKAKKITLLGRRVKRNIRLAEGQLKEALTQDYADLQGVLDDLRLVDTSVAKFVSTKASDENRFVMYRLADESLIDAEMAYEDVLTNVKTVEATAAAKLKKTALAPAMPDMAPAETPVYGDANYGDGGFSSQVENPDRAKVKSPPMPGGGMPYEEGGELYVAPDSRYAAPFNTSQPAAHGDLPYREWEQLELKNLSEGPHGSLRSFDKVEWVMEPLVESTKLPTGNVYDSKEAEGGGVSHVDELQEPAPGLNMDLPDGRWGFESAGKEYMQLPEGGMGGMSEAPGMEAPAEEMSEKAPEMEAPAEEEMPESEEKDEEKSEEPEEKDEEESEESEEPEEEEEKEEVEASNEAVLMDRRSRTKARTQILKSAEAAGGGAAAGFAEYYNKPGFKEYYNKPGFKELYGLDGGPESNSAGSRKDVPAEVEDDARKTRKDSQPGAAAPAEAAPAAEEADVEVAASFQLKKTEAAKQEIVAKQKRAYDLALDFQRKGWIDATKDALHRQATLFANLDEAAFGTFKAMCDGFKSINRSAEENKEEKIERIAGKQRKVLKTGSTADEANLLTQLQNLDWH